VTAGGERWIAVCPLERTAREAIARVSVEEFELLLVRDGDDLFACERICPHEQADLSLGRVTEGRLFCPRHLASFDLRNGDISTGWPSRGLRRYPVRIAEGQVWIDAAAVRKAET
jgi:3-phenylpropionate/trans-cinnamate dioxygenase ferredoxin component